MESSIKPINNTEFVLYTVTEDDTLTKIAYYHHMRLIPL